MHGVLKTWHSGVPETSARISFATPELLWEVFTAKRWELLKALCGAGPVSIGEAARRVGRDAKAVHADVTALLKVGVLDRAKVSGVVFPYEAVKVEFMLKARSPIGASNRTGTVAKRAGMLKRPGQKRVPTKEFGFDFALPAKPRAKAKLKPVGPEESKRFVEEARKLDVAGVTAREFNRRFDVILATKEKLGPKSRSRKKRGEQ